MAAKLTLQNAVCKPLEAGKFRFLIWCDKKMSRGPMAAKPQN
jgi:hypothetical protein